MSFGASSAPAATNGSCSTPPGDGRYAYGFGARVHAESCSTTPSTGGEAPVVLTAPSKGNATLDGFASGVCGRRHRDCVAPSRRTIYSASRAAAMLVITLSLGGTMTWALARSGDASAIRSTWKRGDPFEVRT